MILMLDYDGTLTPIVLDPGKAYIDRARKKFLEELSKIHTLAIVTGRDMKSFKGVFGGVPPSIYVITSHGANLYKGESLIKRLFHYRMPDLQPLRRAIEGFEGVILEEKEGCFALHYRGFDGDEKLIKDAFYDFVRLYPPVKVVEGKKVLEGIYGEFDKGRGVEKFLRFLGKKDKGELLYIGDDTTDLYAMRKVKSLGGKTAFVGDKKPQEADLLLRSVDEVYEFLSSLRSE